MQLIKPEYMALFYTSCSLFLGQFLIDKANIIHENESFSQTFVTFPVGLAAVRAIKVSEIIKFCCLYTIIYMCLLTSCEFFRAACMALV